LQLKVEWSAQVAHLKKRSIRKNQQQKGGLRDWEKKEPSVENESACMFPVLGRPGSRGMATPRKRSKRGRQKMSRQIGREKKSKAKR